MNNAFLNTVRFKDVKSEIADSDLLLFRGNRLIARAGRSDYSHAAMAARWGDDLFCLEVREFFGGRAILLERELQNRPKGIDVFEANPSERWSEYDAKKAVQYMRRLTGCRYGWRNLFRVSLYHIPLIRLFISPNMSDDSWRNAPPFCSQAVVMSDRLGGGVDPVPQLADRLTEPSDLARSPFYRYRFTIVP